MTPTLLIADCGATSGKWAVVDRLTGTVSRFSTGPINPSVYSRSHISTQLSLAAGQVKMPIGSVQMYVAGAVGHPARTLAAEVARSFAVDPEQVRIETDLTGACRALLGDRRGIACILGTGSNSCLWSGSRIELNLPPMGYILGDEGSGSAIGAALLRRAIRNLFPDDLKEKWHAAYPALDYPSLVEAVYREHKGSGYIASCVPFAVANKAHPFIARLLADTFSRFFTDILSAYPGYRDMPVAFTGGVAAVFGDILRSVAEAHGLVIDRIEADPLGMLIKRALEA